MFCFQCVAIEMHRPSGMGRAVTDMRSPERWTSPEAARFNLVNPPAGAPYRRPGGLRVLRLLAVVLSVWTLAVASSAAPIGAQDAGDAGADGAGGLWAAHVQPLLQKKCVRCHGGASQKNDLDLRTPATILRGGERGPAFVPGRPAESLILEVIQPGAELHMPPDEDQALSEEEVLFVRRWIEKAAGPGTNEREEDGKDAWTARTPAAPHAEGTANALPPPGLTPHLVIDLLIESGWKKRGVEPSPRADDATFVRRVYLDLAGRIPSIEEARAFFRETASDKRERLVERLLQSGDYARHMSEVFDVALLGRAKPRTIDRRRSSNWFTYLEWAFATGRGWNEIVRDLIVARPGSSEERGAVSFLREARNKHQEIAERASPALFGLRVECAQCHDHPVAPEIEQRHYWGLVSFFSRTTNIDTRSGPGVAESAIGGFSKYADLEGENHDAELVFFDGTVVPEKRPAEGEKEKDAPEKYLVAPPAKGERAARAPVPKFSRREELYRLAADTDLVARSFVNRMWAILMGRGLVHPVDKMDSAHPPSHPRLLDWLARDFIESGYDVKHLVRAITSSRAYQLESRVPGGAPRPQPDSFAYALDKPLSAETLYRSMLIATGAEGVDGGRGRGLELDTPEAVQFAAVFPDVFPEEKISNLKQALFLTNSRVVDALLEPKDDNTAERLLALADTGELVRRAFDIVFGRAPVEPELERSVAYLEARKDRRKDGVKQLLWAMLTSAEFRMNR